MVNQAKLLSKNPDFHVYRWQERFQRKANPTCFVWANLLKSLRTCAMLGFAALRKDLAILVCGIKPQQQNHMWTMRGVTFQLRLKSLLPRVVQQPDRAQCSQLHLQLAFSTGLCMLEKQTCPHSTSSPKSVPLLQNLPMLNDKRYTESPTP